jgi:uncharacterized circularly permuted ATP-grasp superfamily protein/uncharacterized alpha-E superfamily protein
MLPNPAKDFAHVSRSLTHPIPQRLVRGLRYDIYDPDGNPRPGYEGPLAYLQGLRRPTLRALDEHMEATLREMGVTYGLPHGEQVQPWVCDLLPHIFTAAEWDQVTAGVSQRIRAFELFLKDIYGPRQILRDGVIPVHPVLGSPHYEAASMGVPLPHDAYLHLSGLCLTRNAHGQLAVKAHHMSRAAGISYMIQNRRALATVVPDLFEQNTVRSLADALSPVVETLRGLAERTWDEPSAVLLSPGTANPLYSEHSFLARRMGIPLVQGGDLLVLDDHVHLKTVRGLKRVDVIYNHVADERLDSLVFKKGSTEGVPGIVHCLRRGTVKLVNALGSQLVDDASLLSMAPRIIRYYLQEGPILPTVRTYWLGDLDQLEMVIENIEDYHIRPISASNLGGAMPTASDEIARAVRKRPGSFVAQPLEASGQPQSEFEQDHIVFALRRGGDRYEVFPGALTRVFPRRMESQTWISKDSWVPALSQQAEAAQTWTRNSIETHHPTREVTSRVAESFYWMGRYLERAYHQAYLIQAVETLESEELNASERRLYRPMWNRLLPPLETTAGESRRSITTRQDRYRLILLAEPGTVARTFTRAMANAESIRESLSPEALASLNRLRDVFQRTRFRENLLPEECGQIARRLSGIVTESIPQFFAIAQRTVLGDDGWRFCEAGELLERAIITSHAVLSISRSMIRPPLATEIQLSAFLRLLGTRDAYRRVYQMRAEPVPIIELLFQHPESPRSVLRCLTACADLLRKSAAPDQPGASSTLNGIESLIHQIRRIDWSEQMRFTVENIALGERKGRPLEGIERILAHLSECTLRIHHLISDGFLSHQAFIAESVQPMLLG